MVFYFGIEEKYVVSYKKKSKNNSTFSIVIIILYLKDNFDFVGTNN